jgi:hypothetical protein
MHRKVKNYVKGKIAVKLKADLERHSTQNPAASNPAASGTEECPQTHHHQEEGRNSGGDSAGATMAMVWNWRTGMCTWNVVMTCLH